MRYKLPASILEGKTQKLRKILLILLILNFLVNSCGNDPVTEVDEFINDPLGYFPKYKKRKEEEKLQKQAENLFNIIRYIPSSSGSSSSSSTTNDRGTCSNACMGYTATTILCKDNFKTAGIYYDDYRRGDCYAEACNYSTGSKTAVLVRNSNCKALGYSASMLSLAGDKSTPDTYTCKFTTSSTVSFSVCPTTVLTSAADQKLIWQDNTLYAVSNTSPSNAATGVSIYAPIIITASKLLDPDTVNSTNITISVSNVNQAETVVHKTYANASSGNNPAGSLIYVYPNPVTASWASATAYKVTITTNVKDYFGLGLASDYSFTFTTN